MLLLLFLLLLFVNQCSGRPQVELQKTLESEESYYQTQREYHYVYDGQYSTGLPQQSTQFGSTRFQANLTLQFITATSAILKVNHIQLGSANGALIEHRELQGHEHFEKQQIDDQYYQLFYLPVRFDYIDGLVSGVIFDRNDKPWFKNFKRGILNILQINIKKKDRAERERKLQLHQRFECDPCKRYYEYRDFFRSQEKTMEGDCEVQYTFNKHYDGAGDEFMPEVVRSINMDSCKKRTDIRYGYHLDPSKDSNDCIADQKRLETESSTVYHYYLNGNSDKFIIRRVDIRSHHLFSPFGKDVLGTFVTGKMELKKIVTGVMEHIAPEGDFSDSVEYSAEREIKVEKFIMQGDEEYSDDLFHHSRRKYEQFEEIIRKLTISVTSKEQEMQSESTGYMRQLVDLLKMCSKEKIQKIHENYFESCSEFQDEVTTMKIRDLILDGYAQAGTRNTIDYIVQQIESEKISILKSVKLLARLIRIHVVSQKHIDSVFGLCKHPVCQRNPMLRQTCLLTAGGMIHTMCGERGVHLALQYTEEDLCPRAVKEKYLDELIELYKASQQRFDKILILKALGNAGIDISLPSVERIIRDTKEEKIIRTQAIESLRRLCTVMPHQIQKLLMPYFKSEREESELRMTALIQILNTLPERSVLDQIAHTLLNERSQQVVSFAYTFLRSIASSENPLESRIAKDLQQSIYYAREQKTNWTDSCYYHIPFYSQRHQAGLNVGLGTMFTKETTLPRRLMFNLDTILAGQMKRNAFQIGMIQFGAENLIQQLFEHSGGPSLKDSLVHEQGAESMSSADLLRSIYKKMNVKSRQGQADIHGMLYFRYGDIDTGFIQIDQQTVPLIVRAFQGGQLHFNRFREIFGDEYTFNEQFSTTLLETTRRIPTCLGVPLIIDRHVMAVGNLNTDVKLEFRTTETSGLHDGAITVVGKPNACITHTVNMRICSPLLYSGMRMEQTAKVNVPLDLNIEFNAHKKLETKLSIKMPTVKQPIFAYQTKTVTVTSNWPTEQKLYEEKEEIIKCDLEQRGAHKIDRTYGEQILGLRYNLRGQFHRRPSTAWWTAPVNSVIDENDFMIEAIPGHNTPKEIVFTLGLGFEKKQQIKKVDIERFVRIAKVKKLFELDKEEDNDVLHLYADGTKIVVKDKEEVKQTVIDESERREEFTRYITKYTGERGYNGLIDLGVTAVESTIPRSVELRLDADCDESLHFCKFDFKARRSAIFEGEKEDWTFESVFQSIHPKRVRSFHELKQQKHREFNGQWDCFWGSGEKYFMNISIQGEQDRAQQDLLQQCLQNEASSVHQYQDAYRATQLNKYKIAAQYRLSSGLQSCAQFVYGFLKMWLYLNSEVDVTTKGEQNQVIAKMTVDPLTHQYMNVHLETCDETVTFKEIGLPFKVSGLLLNMYKEKMQIQSIGHLLKKSMIGQRAECLVSGTHVRTFDESRVKMPMTTCYSVLAKDCRTEHPSFIVMMKKKHKHGPQDMKMKIIDHQRVMELERESETDMKIVIDKKRVIDEDELLSKGVNLKDRLAVVDLEDVHIRFDGYSASIKISPIFKNGQCGICGHYDGEKYDEFRKSDNQHTTNLEDYHRSYFHQDEECDIEEDVIKDKKNYDYLKEQIAREIMKMIFIEKRIVVQTVIKEEITQKVVETGVEAIAAAAAAKVAASETEVNDD